VVVVGGAAADIHRQEHKREEFVKENNPVLTTPEGSAVGVNEPNGWIVRARVDAGIQRQKFDARLDAHLNTPGALRRIGRDVIED
jgi:hypothetical protein